MKNKNKIIMYIPIAGIIWIFISMFKGQVAFPWENWTVFDFFATIIVQVISAVMLITLLTC